MADDGADEHADLWRVCVILVNYNNEAETRGCIDSLFAAQRPSIKLDIVIVDNSDKVEIGAIDDVLILRPKRNLGLSPAWALAFKTDCAQASDFVIFMNNDVNVAPDFFAEFEQGVDTWGKETAFGGRIYYREDPERIWSRGGRIDAKRVVVEHHDCEKLSGEVAAGDFETGHISGCCMIIPTKKLVDVGGPDPNFFFRGEEWDLNYRLLQSGTRLLILDRVVMWHHVNASHDRFKPEMLYLAYRAKVLFARKHHNALWFMMWFAAGLTYSILIAPRKFARMSNRAENTLRRPLVQAFIDGVRMLTIQPKSFSES